MRAPLFVLVLSASGCAHQDAPRSQVDLVSQHPFVVYQALKNADRFTRSELAGYLEMLVRIDLALKSTGQEPRLLLERFLLAVCKVNA